MTEQNAQPVWVADRTRPYMDTEGATAQKLKSWGEFLLTRKRDGKQVVVSEYEFDEKFRLFSTEEWGRHRPPSGHWKEIQDRTMLYFLANAGPLTCCERCGMPIGYGARECRTCRCTQCKTPMPANLVATIRESGRRTSWECPPCHREGVRTGRITTLDMGKILSGKR